MTLAKPPPHARLPLTRVSVERRLRRNPFPLRLCPRHDPRRPSPSRKTFQKVLTYVYAFDAMNAAREGARKI